MDAITLYPQNQSQQDLLIALAHELKMRFTTDNSGMKSEFLASMVSAAREAKQIAKGEIEAESLDELLAEA